MILSDFINSKPEFGAGDCTGCVLLVANNVDDIANGFDIDGG